jgi:hypothetical protein
MSQKEINLSREIWNGTLPVEFILNSEELVQSEKPDSIFIMCSRMSYLGIITEEVVRYFNYYVVDFDNSIYFTHNGSPLRAHLPFGVIYDSLSHLERKKGINIISKPSLPLKITIHFKDAPKQILLECNTTEAKSLFFHSTKQACHLLYGSTRLFTSLSLTDQNALLDAANKGERDAYESAIKTLKRNTEDVRNPRYPVRIVFSNGITKQVPVKIEENLTLLEVVTAALSHSIASQFEFQYQIFLQGINNIPPHSTLRNIYNMFHSADLWLYIIVVL